MKGIKLTGGNRGDFSNFSKSVCFAHKTLQNVDRKDEAQSGKNANVDKNYKAWRRPRKMRQVHFKFSETLSETIHVKTKLTLRPFKEKK